MSTSARNHRWMLLLLLCAMAMAAVAAGSDGLMIEVHNDPPHALSDGAQSLTPVQFDEVARKIRTILSIIND